MSLATIPPSLALATLADNTIDDNTLAVFPFLSDPDDPNSSGQPVAAIMVTGKETAKAKLQTPEGLSAGQTVRDLFNQEPEWKNQRLLSGTDHEKWLERTRRSVWDTIDAYAKRRNPEDLRLAMVGSSEDWKTLNQQGCSWIHWECFPTDTGTKVDPPRSKPLTASASIPPKASVPNTQQSIED